MKMLKPENKIFTNIGANSSPYLKEALKRGDWSTTGEILADSPQNILKQVTTSGLKGRGGAGFLTSMKWGFMPNGSRKITRYLVINADEGEPGTCKDREILRCEPHKLIEGILLACYGLGVHHCYIYIRGEFYQEALVLQKAIDEAYEAGYLGDNCLNSKFSLRVDIHMGAGAYICGEETAMLESLEGKKGQPRLKPPYPPQVGLYGVPTTVQNVETIAVIPTILRRGGAWFASLGNKGGRGTKLFCISGNVHKPCTIEEEMGVELKELIENYAGGVVGGWNNLQAIIPGGSSTPILPKELCEGLKLDFDSLKAAGSYLGTGAIIVLNNSVDIIEAVHNLAAFYKHESCGQCTPCREGCGWMMNALAQIQNGNATKNDIQTLEEVAEQIEGHTICAFGEAAATPVKSLIKHFDKAIQKRLLREVA